MAIAAELLRRLLPFKAKVRDVIFSSIIDSHLSQLVFLPVCFHVLLAIDICFERLLAVGTHKRSLLLYNVQVPYSLWSKEIIILFKTVSGKRSFETLIRCLAMISVNSIKYTDNLF